MDIENLFEISEEESRIMGYTIARGNNKTLLNTKHLNNKLKHYGVDILKLTLDNTQPNLYQCLNEIQLPYYVLGMVIEFKALFKPEPLDYLNKYIEFKEYFGDDDSTFKQLVQDIFSETASSFYINPDLHFAQHNNLHAMCLAAYLSKQNSTYDANKYTHLLYYKNEIAGFISSYKKGSGGGVTYAGILPKFAGKALYTDMIRFIQNYGRSIGQKWGTFHCQLQNTRVIKMHFKSGIMPIGHSVSVHINAGYGKGLISQY